MLHFINRLLSYFPINFKPTLYAKHVFGNHALQLFCSFSRIYERLHSKHFISCDSSDNSDSSDSSDSSEFSDSNDQEPVFTNKPFFSHTQRSFFSLNFFLL